LLHNTKLSPQRELFILSSNIARQIGRRQHIEAALAAVAIYHTIQQRAYRYARKEEI
jgi:hypothetical protein